MAKALAPKNAEGSIVHHAASGMSASGHEPVASGSGRTHHGYAPIHDSLRRPLYSDGTGVSNERETAVPNPRPDDCDRYRTQSLPKSVTIGNSLHIPAMISAGEAFARDRTWPATNAGDGHGSRYCRGQPSRSRPSAPHMAR